MRSEQRADDRVFTFGHHAPVILLNYMQIVFKDGVETKQMRPSLYAILLVGDDMNNTMGISSIESLDLIKEYSLETAIKVAQLKLEAKVNGIKNIRLKMYYVQTFEEIFPQLISEMPEETVNRINGILTEIIKTRNQDLYERYQGVFSPAEEEMIQDALKSRGV